MDTESLKIGKIYSEAWQYTKDNLPFLIGYALIILLLSFLPGLLGESTLASIVQFIAWIFSITILLTALALAITYRKITGNAIVISE